MITRVQHGTATQEAFERQLDVALPRAAALGSLLVSAVVVNKSAGGLAPSAGWRVAALDDSASVTVAMAWRIADGTAADSCRWTWSAYQRAVAWIVEHDGCPAGVDVAASVSGTDEREVLEVALGPVAVDRESVAIGLVGVDTWSNWSIDVAWSDGFDQIAEVATFDDPGGVLGDLVTAGPTVSTTVTSRSPTGDQASGILAVFTPRAPAVLVPAGAGDDVTVRVQALDGTWETCGADRAIGVVPESVEFSADEWGPSTASFTLRRRPDAVWPDLAPFGAVAIEVGGVVRWRGRTSETPVADGAAPAISVQCRGLQYHLDEDVLRRVYVHARLSDWRDQRSMPDARLGKAANYAAGQVGTGEGAITLTMPDGQPVAVGTCVGVVLDLGPLGDAAAAIVLEVETSANTAHNSFYARSADTADWGLASSWSDAYSGSVDALGRSATIQGGFSSPQRYVHLFLHTSVAYTLADDVWVKIRRATVFTDASYRSGGSSALTASTVIHDALDQATLLLSGDRSQIASTAFGIDALAPTRFVTAREQCEGVNAYHNRRLQLDLADRLVFQPRPAAPEVEVGAWSGAELRDASAGSGDQVYNRAVLDGEDPVGDPVVVERRAGQLVGARRTRIGVPPVPNPSFDDDASGWYAPGFGGAGPPTRDTGEYLSAPASGLLGADGFLSEGATTLRGEWARGSTYLLQAWIKVRDGVAVTGGGLSFGDHSAGDVSERSLWVLPSLGWIAVSVSWTPRASRSAAELRIWAIANGSVWIDDVEVFRLVSTVVDRRGGIRTRVIEPRQRVTPAGAQQLADTFLAAHVTTPLRGEVSVGPGGCRTVLGGAPVHPSALPGMTQRLLRLSHRVDPDTGGAGARQGVIANVTYTHRDRSAAVSLDDPRRNFQALMSRLELAQGG